jgi:hypothetical protein
MSLLEVVKEEQRRKAAGLSPLPTPPRPARAWLKRSGHDWKVRLANYAGLAPVAVLLVWFMSARAIDGRHEPRWMSSLFTFAMLGTLACAFVAGALRALVRCRVCGLRLASCSQARTIGSRKWLWVATLDACPVCGDDGSASPESRTRWRDSGLPAEAPYWSWKRIAIAILLAVIIAGAGVWYGASYRPNPATWSQDFVEGVTVK